MELGSAFLVGYVVGTLPFGIILLKGNVALFGLALLVSVVAGGVGVPLVGIIAGIAASVRLGRPNSWWAGRFYGEDKIVAARFRSPHAGSEPARWSALAGGVLLVVLPVGAVVAAVLT